VGGPGRSRIGDEVICLGGPNRQAGVGGPGRSRIGDEVICLGGPNRQAGGWHGGKVLPPGGKTAPVTGPAGRTSGHPRRL